jgi:hypothetical protein
LNRNKNLLYVRIDASASLRAVFCAAGFETDEEILRPFTDDKIVIRDKTFFGVSPGWWDAAVARITTRRRTM